ncbi:MAG TPA: M55 family metallopeptidase [Rubrobacteraceae bacterium]|nr:M55 family metallopeptidase [Rubrobacteraceae bacterium]
MKVYISADMEGVTGVTGPDDVIPGRSQYDRFRKLLTAGVNVAIEGAAGGGATEFLVNEAHDGMKNILIEDLDPRAEIIVGQRKPLSMMEGFHGADVVFFVGYHARAGVEGVLSHTYNVPTTVVEVHLNDGPCSEARMNAGLAGTEDIPIGLVTGDDVTCEEARSLYSGVETAQVKTAIGRYTARCLVPKVAQQRIREAAESAVRGVGEMEPYVLEPPYTFTVEFATANLAASALRFPETKRLGDRRVSWTNGDYGTAYRMLLGVMSMMRGDPDYG